MTKYIVRAANENDLVDLMINTKSALARGVKWDATDISNVGETDAQEWKVSYDVRYGNFDKVDAAIMGSEVPTGGMVVICDGDTEPAYGFVCGNGSEWHEVKLPHEVQEAIVPPRQYGVDLGVCNRQRKWFESRQNLKDWVLEGLFWTEGAEQDHYTDMLAQLEDGNCVLKYYRQ